MTCPAASGATGRAQAKSGLTDVEPTAWASVKTSTPAPLRPVPVISASPATRGESRAGGGGARTTTAGDSGPVTPPSVWWASTTCPAERGRARGTIQPPSSPTRTLPIAAPSTTTPTLAPIVPAPLTLVLPATMGSSTSGAGGEGTTVADADNGLDTPPTASEASTTWPAVNATASATD